MIVSVVAASTRDAGVGQVCGDLVEVLDHEGHGVAHAAGIRSQFLPRQTVGLVGCASSTTVSAPRRT